jgi:hypothetical protein
MPGFNEAAVNAAENRGTSATTVVTGIEAAAAAERLAKISLRKQML